MVRREPEQIPGALSSTNDEFLSELDTDIAKRRRQSEEYEARAAPLRRQQALYRSIMQQLQDVEQSAPPHFGLGQEIEPFDSRAWAALLVVLAESWREYHDLAGQLTVPKLSAEHGHHAGHRIFACAVETQDVDQIAVLVDDLLPRLYSFGRTVALSLERPYDGVHGIQDYYKMLGFEFEKRGGDLIQYEGRFLPGAIRVTPRVSTAPAAERVARKRSPTPDPSPTQTPNAVPVPKPAAPFAPAAVDAPPEETATSAPTRPPQAARATPEALPVPEHKPAPPWHDRRTGGVPLRGWLQISKALDVKSLRAKHKQLKRLNLATDGPITWVGRTPEVDHGELVAWIEATRDRATASDERLNRNRTLAALDERDGAHATDHGLTRRARPHGRTKQRPD